MTGDGDQRQPGQEEDAQPDAAEAADPVRADASCVVRHKVGLPDPIEGYVERSALEIRCALLDRRLTVLHAPGGSARPLCSPGAAGRCASGASRSRGSRSTRRTGRGR